MLQSPSSTSTQKSIIMTFTDYQEANRIVALLDEEEELILSFMPGKKYQSIIISSPLLEEGKTYSLSYGGNGMGQGRGMKPNDGQGGKRNREVTLSDTQIDGTI